MVTLVSNAARRDWQLTGYSGPASGLISAAVLAWRGGVELHRPLAGINAPSHWLWGDRALRSDGLSTRYSAAGALTHLVSALLWGALYDGLRRRRSHPTASNAITDAVAVTTFAAGVDLAVVPQRLTPGFEKRLSKQGLFWVYAGLAAGLALGGIMSLRGR